MKRLTVLLLLVLFTFSLAHAQEPNVIGYNNFEFTLDPALYQHVNITSLVGDPVDMGMPGGPQPNRVELGLYNEFPTPEGYMAPTRITLYKVADFAGYPFYTDQLTALQTLLTERPDLAPYMVNQVENQLYLPFLPVFPAAQVIRARAQYVENEFVSGISYITAYGQAPDPFLADQFLYTFQGISQDGSIYISMTTHLNTALFPAEYPADLNYEEFVATIMDYFNTSVATLNAAAPTDFSPALPTLETLVQSFRFE